MAISKSASFSGFLTQFVGSFARFQKSGSINFAVELPDPHDLRSGSSLEIAWPGADIYTELRAAWKSRRYADMPLKGIRLLDDNVGTNRSLLTVKFVCKPLGRNEPSPYPGELADAILRDANEQEHGYIAEYSYSFYPDVESERAREIGYFRYDFHPRVMGVGDKGGHPYFHFHSGLTGEELEEVELQAELDKEPSEEARATFYAEAKNMGQELRLPTGLIMPESILSALEYKLAPGLRSERIEKAFGDLSLELHWYYLMLDLTPKALKERLTERYSATEFERLLQTAPCQQALTKARWHDDLFKKPI